MISLIPNNYFEMKNIFWIIAAAFAFVACSDDDGPCEKPFDGEVVSFEASEHLLDAMTGDDVKLGPVTMSLMGMGDYTYANAFCAKQYAVEADFDGMLFSTADQNLVFNADYSSLYDGWGGIGLSRMPTGMRPLPPASSSSPCGRTAVPTVRKPMPYFTIPTRRRKCIPNT